MPTRDGSGPLGQGSRTGRGMGNCISTRASVNQTLISGTNKRFNWGGLVWNAIVGYLFSRRRGNRLNRK